jgi:hypothetical protein
MIYWQWTIMFVLGLGTAIHWFEVATRKHKTTEDSLSMIVTTSLFVWGLIVLTK